MKKIQVHEIRRGIFHAGKRVVSLFRCSQGIQSLYIVTWGTRLGNAENSPVRWAASNIYSGDNAISALAAYEGYLAKQTEAVLA